MFFKATEPTPDLGTPKLLRCDFIRPELEKITNAVGLRQLRSWETTVDVITNSASSYTLKFYSQTNVLAKTNGLYTFTNSPLRSVTVELVGGDTNQVRVTDSLKTFPTDYVWQGTGWDLVTGNGLRHEARAVSIAGAIRTEVHTIKNAAGVIERQTTEKWQTNTFGDRLIECPSDQFMRPA